MGERAYVADQAKAVEISRSRGGSTLEQSVCARLDVDPSVVTWDAYRTSDGRWVVTAALGTGVVGSWTFEAVGRTVHPQDESARALMGGGPSVVDEPVSHDTRATVGTPQPAGSGVDTELPEESEPRDNQVRPRLVSVTSDPVRSSTPVPSEPAEQTALAGDSGEQETLVDPSELNAPQRTKRAKGKKGRASVPSWDEILFGASRPQD